MIEFIFIEGTPARNKCGESSAGSASQSVDTEHLLPSQNNDLLEFDEGISYEGILHALKDIGDWLH